MNLLQYLSENDNALFIETEKIRKEVERILQNKLHLNYTDYSIEHSLRILDQLSQVVSELMSGDEKLNKYEVFILNDEFRYLNINFLMGEIDVLDVKAGLLLPGIGMIESRLNNASNA